MTNAELITLKELLRDPAYRAYFTKVPQLPEHYTPENMPWKLMILKPTENIWRTKRMGTYEEAFAGLKKLLPFISNAAINCPPLGFMPPTRTVRLKGKYDRKGKQLTRTTMWLPQIAGDMEHHDWCPHCRRPSIFHLATLSRPRKENTYVTPRGEPVIRCIICGSSERVVNLRNPENHQAWDLTRVKVTK